MPNTREKLIELVGSVRYGNISLIKNNFQKGFIEKIADHLIANGVTLANQVASSSKQLASSKWIPVTERLPEERKWVLIYTEIGRTLVAAWYGDGWGTTSFVALNNVTHWMPLPEPPKGE